MYRPISSSVVMNGVSLQQPRPPAALSVNSCPATVPPLTSRLPEAPAHAEQPAVEHRVDGQHEHAQKYVLAPRQPGRIEYRQQVMLEKTPLVADRAGLVAEPILQGRQGTGPAVDLDESAPQGGREVQPQHTTPPVQQQPPSHGEGYEAKVDHDYEFGEDLVKHS